jgi:hypothetical protein
LKSKNRGRILYIKVEIGRKQKRKRENENLRKEDKLEKNIL